MKHHHGQECQELLVSISDYVDGSLESELCRALEQHMQGCEDCQVVVDTLRKTIDLYHAGKADQVPEDIKRRLFKRLEIEELLPAAE